MTAVPVGRGGRAIRGRIAVILLLAVSLIFGVSVWYVQTHVQYQTVMLDQMGSNGIHRVQFTAARGKSLVQIPVVGFEGIRGNSSPLKYRACFRIADDTGHLKSYGRAYDDAIPLVAPRWFECFDAKEIGEALENGAAEAFLMQKDIVAGIDRVGAVFPDGRTFAWQQLNKKYHGRK